MATSRRRHGDIRATAKRRQGDVKATSWQRQGDVKATSKRRQGDISATSKTTSARHHSDVSGTSTKAKPKATSAGHQPRRNVSSRSDHYYGSSSVTVAIQSQRYSHSCRWQTLEVQYTLKNITTLFKRFQDLSKTSPPSSNAFRTSHLQQREFTRYPLKHAPKRHQISYCTCAQPNHTHKRTAFLARDPITDSETALLLQSR